MHGGLRLPTARGRLETPSHFHRAGVPERRGSKTCQLGGGAIRHYPYPVLVRGRVSPGGGYDADSSTAPDSIKWCRDQESRKGATLPKISAGQTCPGGDACRWCRVIHAIFGCIGTSHSGRKRGEPGTRSRKGVSLC